ncbi:helix-turn-helix domain-containing protein [Chitinophaga pendula]|uniref:helix-turn-helix domain-containing protein n=1 Tax=Chitinophaga TaxID=79328 RepID=UPI000BB03E4F|nr:MULTISPECIES: helix-turn-helix transcriptional regulator [Chitinophaga]ASZ10994.1 DNA-binding protein [Chitinophaga sp. MD30]UCJ06015.1 helix-turn-helix domain-containing protein [Chitinophaga pendula]
MNIGQQILFLLSALGAVNAIILSLYLFFNKKKRSLSTIFLGILLLTLSLRVIKSVFIYFNPQLDKILVQIGLTACFFIGPSLYYFVRSVLGKVERMPRSWKWSLGLQAGLIFLIGVIWPYSIYLKVWKVMAYVIYVQWFAYVVASGYAVWPSLKLFFTDRSLLTGAARYALMVYSGNTIIFAFYLAAIIFLMRDIYIMGPVSLTFLLYLNIVMLFFGKGLDNNNAGKVEKKKIATDDALLWIDRLEKVIGEKALYKDPNLKLHELAQHINISAHQLSQLLNDNIGKSFSTYINEYRIREACRLITSSDHLTIEAIGYEVGYNSKSTFYTAFKKVMDTTPSLYKEGLAKII